MQPADYVQFEAFDFQPSLWDHKDPAELDYVPKAYMMEVFGRI